MKDDRKTFKMSGRSSTIRSCPSCGRAIRHMGTIYSGKESVNIYRCNACRREFVEEELTKREAKL